MTAHPPSPAHSISFPLGPDDRDCEDRRREPTPLLCRYTILGGRRRGGRRGGETLGVFVDQHGLVLFSIGLAIIALNILDAWFTILLLTYGGEEMNPVVAGVLSLGLAPFIAIKSLGIGVCLAFLTITKNFPISRVGMSIVLVGYLVLLIWHLYLVDTLDLV